MISRHVRMLSLVLIGFLFTTPIASLACGPFTLGAIFTFTVHPEYPLEKFARGDIGVVQPSYARSYLFVAYRYLSEAPFNQAEQKALLELWQQRLDYRWEPGDQDWRNQWLEARQKVPGLNASPKIDVYRSREKPNQYETYLNCHKDSFETAVETLDARIKQFGVDSSAVKQWVEAQDLVFSNCSDGKNVPDALPADANELLQADRQYQIAAANFYAGNFDDAKSAFEAIAADGNSPWRVIATYLAARSLIRKASLGPDETRSLALAEAEEQLNRILKDSKLTVIHADASRLLNIVRIRLYPQDKLHELGIALARPDSNPNLKQDLWDYTTLLDGTPEAPNAASRVSRDDLTDWIMTFQSEQAASLDHSIEMWRRTNSVPWLVASLSKIDSQHPQAGILRKAATQVLPSSHAFASVSFHHIRLDLEAGRVNEAQSRLDDLLEKRRVGFDRSSVNLLRHQRMLASNTLDEFLEYAQRIPAGLSWDEDSREVPTEPSEVSEEIKPLLDKPLFDDDAAQILNKGTPLAVLVRIAESNKLPIHLRRDVVQAVWLRAALLDDHTSAARLVPTLKSMVPEMSSLLDDYLTRRQAEAKKFSAIYLWLKFPGLEPVVDSGLGRSKGLREQDSYRDNWWCGASFSPQQSSAQVNPIQPGNRNLPSFLTSPQTAGARREHLTLTSLGAAPNYISRQVIDWATKNPTDSRVPEALHLAVKTTRFGCSDKETGRWSKAAYDLLHRRYPRSEWTKRTPYWFKN